jgi:hypothetical protein
MASAAAVQSWSFLFTSGITSAIFDLAFCVARTWLAVTTDLVTLGSSTCTPSVSRKGALYCKAGCIRSPMREPICHSAKRSGKLLIEKKRASSTSGLASFHRVRPLGCGSWMVSKSTIWSRSSRPSS